MHQSGREFLNIILWGLLVIPHLSSSLTAITPELIFEILFQQSLAHMKQDHFLLKVIQPKESRNYLLLNIGDIKKEIINLQISRPA